MIKRTETYRDAHNLSIACGGFVYEYCGDFFHVPADKIVMAESCGMTLVSL